MRTIVPLAFVAVALAAGIRPAAAAAHPGGGSSGGGGSSASSHEPSAGAGSSHAAASGGSGPSSGAAASPRSSITDRGPRVEDARPPAAMPPNGATPPHGAAPPRGATPAGSTPAGGPPAGAKPFSPTPSRGTPAGAKPFGPLGAGAAQPRGESSPPPDPELRLGNGLPGPTGNTARPGNPAWVRTRPPHPQSPEQPSPDHHGHHPSGWYDPYPGVVCSVDDEAFVSDFSDYEPGPCTLVCRTDPAITCTSPSGDCQLQRNKLVCDGQALPCPGARGAAGTAGAAPSLCSFGAHTAGAGLFSMGRYQCFMSNDR
jgi:hypothetical protein